ncbi:hypothetical protein N7540_003613 [Penicillium herquei]|nr:hypothetical protein N7540_003613 [Penicillium herquei]
MPPNRDPQDVQAWIIGSGIASLAAAVHLVKARVPACQIHILDIHKGSGGSLEEITGSASDGYVLHAGAQPSFHEDCVEELLAMTPSVDDPEKSVLDTINNIDMDQKLAYKSKIWAVRNEEGKLRLDAHRMQIGSKLRMELIKFLLEREKAIDSRKIIDAFDESFFQTEFWLLWSNAFLLQPWHSATEFRRILTKYLPKLQIDKALELERTRFSLYETLILPITKHLKHEGVDFRFNAMVTDLKSYPDSDPTTISEIMLTENGKDELVTVDPSDIIIMTLGSISTGLQTGSNEEPPKATLAESLKDGGWSLWDKLSKQSPKFGNPSNFSSRVDETKIETFTVTFRESSFMKYYSQLVKENPTRGSQLGIIGSPWGLNISVPHQPIFETQPDLVDVVWGYGLHPEKKGKYVQKPMEHCSGAEILYEVLSYLKFPMEELLSSAITIPCMVPLGTAMLLTRELRDRPNVIPHDTTNVAFIGQYVEIPDDTTFSVEYSVRGAKTAVSKLMGLPQESPQTGGNNLLEVLRRIA